MQLWTYLQMPAMALGAAVSAMAAQNIGAGRWDRVERDHPLGRSSTTCSSPACWSSLLAARRPAGAGPVPRRRQPGAADRPHIQLLATWSFLLFGVTMVLFGTVRANGAVIGPLIILLIGLFPVRLGFALGAYPWLGADALWLSFPVSSLRQHGAGDRLLPPRRLAQGADADARRRAEELVEEAQADAEPGGRINPSRAERQGSHHRVGQVRLVFGVGLAVVDLDIDVARRDLALRQREPDLAEVAAGCRARRSRRCRLAAATSKKSTQERDELALVPQGGRPGAGANIAAGYWSLLNTS